MIQRHLLRTALALLLVALFLAEARAAGEGGRRVRVDVAWRPCPPCDEEGQPLAPAVRYEVLASRDGGPEEFLARTRGDTTCTLKLVVGFTYRVRVVGYDAEGRGSQPSVWSDPIAVAPPNVTPLAPAAAKLPPNRPNPFNPATTIVYAVPAGLPPGAPLSLAVLDVRGREVRRFDVDRAPGEHELRWDGRDAHGALVASGVYVTRFRCGQEVVTRRMTMLK